MAAFRVILSLWKLDKRVLCFQGCGGLADSFAASGIVTVTVTVQTFAVKIKDIYFISNRRSGNRVKIYSFDSKDSVFCYPCNCCNSGNNS